MINFRKLLYKPIINTPRYDIKMIKTIYDLVVIIDCYYLYKMVTIKISTLHEIIGELLWDKTVDVLDNLINIVKSTDENDESEIMLTKNDCVNLNKAFKIWRENGFV